MREFIKHSPFAQELGLRVTEIEDGHAVLEMPFRDGLATFGPVVHGGALATVADTAAMAASFAGAEFEGVPTGATIGLNISYLRAVRSSDVSADARVVKRGKAINFVDVEIRDGDGALAAKGQVIYKIN